MFIIILRFSSSKEQSGQFMDAHKDWIKRGFDDGVFLLIGSLAPNAGGSILAHNASLSEIEKRVNDDPFVQENIVSAEILEIDPARTDPRLAFLN